MVDGHRHDICSSNIELVTTRLCHGFQGPRVKCRSETDNDPPAVPHPQLFGP